MRKRTMAVAAILASIVGGVGAGTIGGNMAAAEEIGSVSTVFKLLGPNHKIVIEAFDDPKVEGVACHIARSKTGGITGALGLAEDTSDASIACRQVGPVKFLEEIEDGEQVFSERRSILFKKLQVVRFYDEKRNTLVYLSYSDRLVEGSPQNSISTVPVIAWPTEPAPRGTKE